MAKELEFNGKRFLFEETKTIDGLVDEIFGDCYHVLRSGIQFGPDDLVVDLGACEGVFSIFMAKLFPVKVMAVEPVGRTFITLMKNITLNGLHDRISPVRAAVGRDLGSVEMVVSKDFSGGSSSKIKFKESDHERESVRVLTLDGLLSDVERVRLMKVDIEGMEYEALYYSDVLGKVDYFTGEFHSNHRLGVEGRRIDGLANWVANRTKLLHIMPIQMAD